MDDAHIRRLDLTLLMVFEGLMRLTTMSAVGAELGLTQSAVSHAVGRLRQIFDDPLFVRRGAGVEPSVRARQLAGPIGEALASVRAALRLGRSFDPATTQRTFTIAALDSVIAAVAPRLLADLASSAPRCQIAFRTFGRADVEAAVVAGDVDLAVGVFPEPPAGTRATHLYREGFRVAARVGHPRLAGGLDLDTYCSLDHMLVSPSGDARGTIDVVLERLGRTRRIISVMPQFLIALQAVSRSDAIVTAPTRLCRDLGPLFDLVLYEPPLQVRGFNVAYLTRTAALDDPAMVWLGSMIRSALAEGD